MTNTVQKNSICLMIAAATLLAAVAVAVERDDSIEEGRRALADRANYPWYDAEKDAINRIDVKTFEGTDGNRKTDWETEATTNNQPVRAPARSGWFGRFLQVILWCLLAIALAAVVALIAWAFLRRESVQESSAASNTVETSHDVDRIEQLPFAVKRPQSDLLGEARRHYEEGNFAEAIIYYFSYQLVELDKHHVIRLTKGKTNRQYLGEARRAPGVRPLLEDTMVAFEDVFFGDHELERSRFEACWARLAQFQQALSGGAA